METKSRTQKKSFWSKRTKIIITSVVALIAATTVAVSINSSKAQTKSETDTRTPHTQSAIAKNNSQIIQTISSQKAASSAIESSKIASQKASEAAEASAKQQAEESAKVAQSSSQAVSAQSNNVSKVETSNSAPSNNNNTQSSQVASTDTSGFNFAGHHFPIAGFSGTGQVPADNNVYQWASDSRWFLIEQGGAAGHIIKSYIHMGTAVTVNGRTYHVTDLVGGIRNDGTATGYYQQHIGQHAIGFQTCDSPGVLTLYFAD